MSFCVINDSNLEPNALKFLYQNNSDDEPYDVFEPQGGVLSTLKYGWIVNGSRIVIVSCKNGKRIGSWDFSVTLQDNSAEIVEVDEIRRPHGKEPLLAISINCNTNGGIVCIFDFIGSKVIRAIKIGENISSLNVIHGGQDIFNLSGPLQNFDGILSIGTLGGNVYIVDICRQLCYEGFGTLEARDELNPCKVTIVSTEDLLDIENHKKNALRVQSHLAIHLNVVFDNTTEHFVLKAPNGADKVHVNKQEVLISALHYCPQLGSLLVGYNFGAFQLWNLMNMELIYTSPICEDHVPISKFAIQEPSDDPKAFCYVWAVYSSDDLNSSLLPYLVMYAFCYESKEFHESYGVLYENFQYCTVRFHMELGFNNQLLVKHKGGKCLRLEAIMHKNCLSNVDFCSNDGSEDVLSLCVFIWKAVNESGIFTYMALFDLNQWYKAQMPNSWDYDDCANYMITLCLTDLTSAVEECGQIFDVVINRKSFQQFIGTQKLEEHYYPSSLSFDTCCLLENRCVKIQYQGIQKALLHQLQSAGPLCLIRPTEIYQEIDSHGLTPLFVDISSVAPISLNVQREVILNVALEQQMIGWLCKCASEWSNGSFTSAGCSLELLTTWAFQRGIVLKNNCDKLCVSLFDHSEVRLDANTINILRNCMRQIKNISFFHSFVINNLFQYMINPDLLVQQSQILKMVEVYFDVLQWMFNVGLLPEFSPSDNNSLDDEEKIRAPYPVDELKEYYRKRRSELHLSSNQRFSSESSLLFIDNLINVECQGNTLMEHWKNDGGDGFYPPTSLQALLRTYLIDGIEVFNKHSVIIYLFLDLAMILDPQKYTSVITHLIKFPAVFKVSPSLIKITQAFWQLDHGDFSTAMEQLLDPLVNQEDLKYWHHKVALKSLLVQEQYNSALLYINVRKPPIVDDEDVLCELSLYISNNMLDEAFYLQRQYKNCFNAERFIKHMYAECCKQGRLNSVIHRNLSDEEEKLFLQYLDDVKHPEAADIKITYFMQRSHYIEAFKTYEECENDPLKKGLVARLNSKARDQIVHSYKKLLPTVSYKFIENCTREPNPGLWREVSRPEPMSVFIHKEHEKTEYKSSLIFAALAKAKQTFSDGLNNVSTLMNATTEEIPFLRTPTLIPARKRSSIQVIMPKTVDEEEGPSPKKKPRLSSKFSSSILSNFTVNIDSSILNTPIIKRRNRSQLSPPKQTPRDLTSTPTSILKVKHFLTEEKIATPSSHTVEETSNNISLPVEKHTPRLSGRRSITRTSLVRFDVPKTLTPSSGENSPLSFTKSNESRSSINDSGNSSRGASRSLTPKNISDSDDVFYSPNSSLNNMEEIEEDRGEIIQCTSKVEEAKGEHNREEEAPHEMARKISPKRQVVSEAKLVKLVDYDPSSSSKESSDTSLSGSPKARRSYKPLSELNASLRSSDRLRKMQDDSNTPSSVEEPPQHEDKNSSTLPKVKPRKSLSRQVLENNAFSRLHTTAENLEVSSRTSSIRIEENEVVTVRSEGLQTDVSSTRIEYSDSYTNENTSEHFSEKHSMKKISTSIVETVLDSDLDCSTSTSCSKTSKLVEDDYDSFSDSLMEYLVEDLRRQRSRPDSSFKRTTASEERDYAKTTRKSPRRSSAERTSSSNDDSQVQNLKTLKLAPRLSKRLSSERLISSGDTSTTLRSSRRLSAERTLPSTTDESETTKVLSFASSPRMSRRLSTDTTDPSSIESTSLTPRRTRSSTERMLTPQDLEESRLPKRFSAERLLPSGDKSTALRSSKRLFVERTQSSIRDDSKTTKVLNFATSPRITRRLSADKSTPNSIETTSSTPRRTRSSAERMFSPQDPQESQNAGKEAAELLKFTPRVKKTPKPLSRKVLENNILTRLTAEYEISGGDNPSGEEFNNVDLESTTESALDSPLQSPDITITDSLLEDLAFEKKPVENLEEPQESSNDDTRNEDPNMTDDLDPDMETSAGLSSESKEEKCEDSSVVEAPVSSELSVVVITDENGQNDLNASNAEHLRTVNGEVSQELVPEVEKEALVNSEDTSEGEIMQQTKVTEDDMSFVYDNLVDDCQPNVFEISEDLTLSETNKNEAFVTFAQSKTQTPTVIQVETITIETSLVEESPNVFEKNIYVDWKDSEVPENDTEVKILPKVINLEDSSNDEKNLGFLETSPNTPKSTRYASSSINCSSNEDCQASEKEFIMEKDCPESNEERSVSSGKNEGIIYPPEIKFEEKDGEKAKNRSIEIQTGTSLLDLDNISEVDRPVTPSRRLTRRRSRLLEGREEPDKQMPMEEAPIRRSQSRQIMEPTDESIKLPAATSTSKTVRTNVRKRTKSVDMPLQIEQEVEHNEATNVRSAPRKLRSASVDLEQIRKEDPLEFDVKEKLRATKRKSGSVSLDQESASDGPSVEKKEGGERRNRRKPKKVTKIDSIESFVNTRRLTRRQGNILVENLKRAPKGATALFEEPIQKETSETPEDIEISPTSSRSSTIITRAKKSSRCSSNASVSTVASDRMSIGSRNSESKRRLRSMSVDTSRSSEVSSRCSKRALSDSESVTSEASSVNSRRKRKSIPIKWTEVTTRTKSSRSKKSTSSKLPGIKEEDKEGST